MKLKEFRSEIKKIPTFGIAKINGEKVRVVAMSNYAIIVQEVKSDIIGVPLRTTILDFNEIDTIEILYNV